MGMIFHGRLEFNCAVSFKCSKVSFAGSKAYDIAQNELATTEKHHIQAHASITTSHFFIIKSTVSS